MTEKLLRARLDGLALDPDNGRPVPYATAWTGNRGGVADDAELGRVRDCDCTPGVGQPKYAEVCVARRRAAIVNRLCEVCAHPFLPAEPYAFIGKAGTGGLVRRAPMHPCCCRWALRVCEGIIRARTDDPGILTCRTYTIRLETDGTVQAGIAPVTPARRRALPADIVTAVYVRPYCPAWQPVSQWLTSGDDDG